MKPQTVPQILRCFTLGRYTARVVDGRLETEGPQPLAGPLPASIKARREELVAYLNEHCGGTWPPAPGSEVYAACHTKRKHRRLGPREFQRKVRERRKLREGAA